MEYTDVPVNGGIIHWTIVGHADCKPMVYLHGLGGNSDFELWKLREFARAYNVRFYAPDLPSHGHSSKTGRFTFRLRDFYEPIVAAVEELGLRSIPVCGHSFGGLLAATLAVNYPDMFTQVGLIDPAIGSRWDAKVRSCWRHPWRLFKLAEQLGYTETNVALGQAFHARRTVTELYGVFTRSLIKCRRQPNIYRHAQAALTILLARHTEQVMEELNRRGIVHWAHGQSDAGIPAGRQATLIEGFHSPALVQVLGALHDFFTYAEARQA